MNRSKYKPAYFRTFPLHYAAASCHVVEFQRQLDAGANPYKPTDEGLTALHAAVANSSVAVVDILLKRFADDLLTARDTVQHRFLWKVEQGEWKKRPILIAWTEEECQAALALATSCPGGIPLNLQVFVLLRHPQQGHRFVALDVCNRDKRTDILDGILSLLPNGIVSLDRSDMRTNAVNYLHMACSYARKEIIAKLISQGASLAFHSGSEHSSPFMAACEAFRMDIVVFLTTNYADRFDPGATNKQDYNALHMSLLRQKKPCLVEHIVQHMLKYRMTKYRESMREAISNIFRYDSKEYKYITIWSFIQSKPLKTLCGKYVKQGQLDLRTRFEASTLLDTLLVREIAVDYCLEEIGKDLDLLRVVGDYTKYNALHNLIRSKQLAFVKDLYAKHGALVKEIFEMEYEDHKPALELLRNRIDYVDEAGVLFILEQHKEYYVKHLDHLLPAITKPYNMTETAYENLCEAMVRIVPQFQIKIDERKNSAELQQNACYDMIRNLRDKFNSTVSQLEANGKRLEDYLDNEGRTLLHIAVDWSEKDLVVKLLDRGFDVMKQDAEGRLPIHFVRRSVSIFELLLEKNEPEQLAYVNRDGFNLLHISCKNGLGGAGLEILLQRGMDVNEPAPNGHLPLSLASCCGTVSFLINHGARVDLLNDRLFAQQLCYMQYCAANQLLSHVAQQDWFKKCAHRLLPWMIGSQNRDFFSCSNEEYLEKNEQVRRLIFDSLYEHSKEEASALFSRVCHNAIVCCARWFLEYDYDIDYNYPHYDQSTPLLGLLRYMEVPNSDIVETLLRKPIDVNAIDDRKRNALIILAAHFKWAKHYGHSLDTFRLLLKHGIKLDAQDENGDTALHCAFEWEQWELVKFLIDSGANTSIRNTLNKLPSEMIPAFSRYLFGYIR